MLVMYIAILGDIGFSVHIIEDRSIMKSLCGSGGKHRRARVTNRGCVRENGRPNEALIRDTEKRITDESVE
ncbi:MAG: hypothetical protein LBJ21_09660 [Acidobacteriota bacterium]|jgi:hypothetical protein|nr:hypothetical protein [Acidobacteriota bacterium]